MDMVVNVGHSQRLNRRGPDAQQNLGSDQQQVHHVGVGSVAASEPRVSVFCPGIVGADVPAILSVPRVAGLILVLMSQELWQGRQQRPQRHDDATAANQPGSVGLGTKVADEQDEGQVADFKAAGDDAHVGTLEVEASLESGQNTYLTNRQRASDIIVNPQSTLESTSSNYPCTVSTVLIIKEDSNPLLKCLCEIIMRKDGFRCCSVKQPSAA